MLDVKKCGIKFPSPYGVSFILIYYDIVSACEKENMFPSPYGVSFILIYEMDGYYYTDTPMFSFRLLTEYHSFL